MTCVSWAHCNRTLFCVMLQCRPGTVKKAVFVTVPGLQRTMSGREDAPNCSCCGCARDTQLTQLILGQARRGCIDLEIVHRQVVDPSYSVATGFFTPRLTMYSLPST